MRLCLCSFTRRSRSFVTPVYNTRERLAMIYTQYVRTIYDHRGFEPRVHHCFSQRWRIIARNWTSSTSSSLLKQERSLVILRAEGPKDLLFLHKVSEPSPRGDCRANVPTRNQPGSR